MKVVQIIIEGAPGYRCKLHREPNSALVEVTMMFPSKSKQSPQTGRHVLASSSQDELWAIAQSICMDVEQSVPTPQEVQPYLLALEKIAHSSEKGVDASSD